MCSALENTVTFGVPLLSFSLKNNNIDTTHHNIGSGLVY